MFKFSTSLCMLCLASSLLAQNGIQVGGHPGVEYLIRDVFIKGNCRNVSNITFIGNDTLSIGQFDNGGIPIDVDNGIILSSGTIDLAQGPNIDNETSFAFNTQSNDPDLGALATGTLFDVTAIEFDFVPLDDRVTFRYVFASEEYCEFVGTAFNDVFGFFVSGPGITGPFDNDAINVATVTALDGTTETVSINTINHLDNDNFYVSNITTTDAQNCEISYNPLYQDLIEYDGFTIPLIASFQVIPCETYRIRLVVGDVADAILDSAVFLEANSFDLGEKVSVRAEVPGSDDPIAYEDCVDGQFVFTRGTSSNINEDCVVEYSISSDSEAINGVDFLEIPLSITIPAGEMSFTLPITVINDMLTEGPESLKLEFTYECDCIDPVFGELIITEGNDFSANLEDITVCADQAFSITPEISGGVSPFDFLWATGAQSETLESSIASPAQYAVTITDFCGSSSSATANIGIQDVPIASLMGVYDLCETADTGIPVQLEGNPPWTITYSIDGTEQTPVEDIQTNPFFLSTPVAGLYELTAFNDAYCEGNTLGSALVEFGTFTVVTEFTPPSCFNSADGSIEITQLEAVSPFTINWSIATGNDYLLQGLEPDTYILSIMDGNGCLYEETFDLNAASSNIIDCAPIYIPNTFSPNRDGVNDVFSVYFDASSGITQVISMQVYDRWGGLVFEETNFSPENGNLGWEGDHQGKPANPGTYVYQIVIAFADGSTRLLSGDITLLR